MKTKAHVSRKEKKSSIKEGKLKKPRFGTVANNKATKEKIKAILFFIIIYGILFLFLYGKILFTPDFDRTDSFHFNFSLKYFLAQNLKHFTFPIWTEQLQGGFPLLAEGQTGVFFIPNLVLLSLFKPEHAILLLLFFSLFIFSVGIYFILVYFGLNSFTASLISINIAFNGALSFRWVHLNLIQTFSLAPLLYYFILKLIEEKNNTYILILSFVISQIIVAGHYQTAFIVIFGSFFWFYVFLIKKNRMNKIQILFTYGLCIFSGIIFSLPQILPTVELFFQSERQTASSYAFATLYPLTPQHIISFFLPFPYGNPKNATYPPFSDTWGIFWENTPYMGTFFIIAFLILIFFIIHKKYQVKKIIYYLFIYALFFLFLALGKDSPLYFLFDIVPFKLFRTQSKYLLLSILFIGISFGLLANQIKEKKIFKLINFLLICNICILLYITFSYHLFLPAESLYKSLSINLDKKKLYYSLGFSKIWNNIFLKNGWKDFKTVNSYLALNKYLIPNSNLIYNAKSWDVNTGGLRLRRMDFITNLLNEGIIEHQDKYIISTNSASLLRLISILQILSPKKIKAEGYKEHLCINDKKYPVFLYINNAKNISHLFYIPKKIKKIRYVNDIKPLFNQGYMNDNAAIVEDNVPKIHSNVLKIKMINDTPMHIKLSTIGADTSFLVIRKNWYPSWQLTIDGKKQKIIRTNIVHMGIILPKGTHTVTLDFIPQSLYIGFIIAVIYIIGLILFLKKIKIHLSE